MHDCKTSIHLLICSESITHVLQYFKNKISRTGYNEIDVGWWCPDFRFERNDKAIRGELIG